MIFQTMNYVRSNNLNLKYQKFTPSGYKDLGVIIFEFVAKTQFLCWWTDWIPLPRTSMLLDLGVE